MYSKKLSRSNQKKNIQVTLCAKAILQTTTSVYYYWKLSVGYVSSLKLLTLTLALAKALSLADAGALALPSPSAYMSIDI